MKTFLKKNTWLLFIVGYILLIRSNDNISGIELLIPIIWIFSDAFELFKKYNYFLSEKRGNSLRINTQNDDIKVSSMIIGTIFIIAFIVFLSISESKLLFTVFLIIAGIISLINQFIYLPSGKFLIKDGRLNFGTLNTSNSVEVQKLSKIEISSEDIKFVDLNQNHLLMNFLNLNESDQIKVRDFLKKNLESKTAIINVR